MMRLELALAAAALGLLLVGPARACGDGSCDAPAPTPEPPAATPHEAAQDREPAALTAVIRYAFCCSRDGHPTWRAALFQDPLQAALQCQSRALRYEEKGQSLPACPHKLGVDQ